MFLIKFLSALKKKLFTHKDSRARLSYIYPATLKESYFHLKHSKRHKDSSAVRARKKKREKAQFSDARKGRNGGFIQWPEKARENARYK